MSKPLEQCRDGLRCRHIHVSAGRPPASRRDFGGHILGPLAVEIGDNDREPVRRQPAGNCFTYAGRTTRHHGYR